MVVIWGSGLYGKVDEVPGFFHVATRFGHLYYVPLIPLASFVVLDESGDQFQGVEVPLSGKSVFVAWLRAACVLAALAAIIAAGIAMAGGELVPALARGSIAVCSIALFVISKRSASINRASYERAIDLGERVGLSEEGRVMMEIVYGRMTAEEAAAQLERLRPAAPSEEATVG